MFNGAHGVSVPDKLLCDDLDDGRQCDECDHNDQGSHVRGVGQFDRVAGTCNQCG